MTEVQVVLVDESPSMVEAWRRTFEGDPEVRVVRGSMLEQDVSAWVTAIDSSGGGLDAKLADHLGADAEAAIRAQIGERHGGTLPLGHACSVSTGLERPPHLVATPIEHRSGEGVGDAMSVALAAAAALQAAHMQNAERPGSIASVALPGLAKGGVPEAIRADLAWTAYHLFRGARLPDFATMRDALEDLLGDLLGTAKLSPRPGAYKRSFASLGSMRDFKATIPDNAAAQAQLRKQLDALRDRDDE